MTLRRPSAANLEAAREAGRTARNGPPPSDVWARRLPPASNRQHRETLLESLTPALREAARAWAERI